MIILGPQLCAFVAAALRTGAERIVKLSALSVGHGATDPITTLHRAGEEAIRDSGIGWTFLRPTAYMSTRSTGRR